MTPQPTDADRERVDYLNGRHGLGLYGAEFDVLAQAFAEVRASAYAQGRADEIEACAASMDKFAEHWRALLLTYRATPETPHSNVELAVTMAQTYEGAALNIRARAAQEGASDGPA